MTVHFEKHANESAGNAAVRALGVRQRCNAMRDSGTTWDRGSTVTAAL